LCFFLRAFLRASASCLRFSSSSLGVKRIHSGTSEGSRYLRFACAEHVSRQRCQGGARLPITSNDKTATAPCRSQRCRDTSYLSTCAIRCISTPTAWTHRILQLLGG
jgi:hypothetical protein